MSLSAQQDVTLALLKKTGLEIEDKNSLNRRLDLVVLGDRKSGQDAVVDRIRNQIALKKEESAKSQNPSQKELGEREAQKIMLEGMIARVGPEEGIFLQLALNDCVKEIHNLSTIKAQTDCQDVVKFIANNTAEWRRDLGIDKKPNCNTLNLSKLDEICRARNKSIKAFDDAALSRPEESLARNEALHNKNLLVLEEFSKVLDQMSFLKREVVAKSPARSSAARLAGQIIYSKEV